MTDHQEIRVPVDGGELTALRWPATRADAPVVLALHGVTANALSWGRVADALAGRATLIAPDLRGRAGSRAVAGPFGIGVHADDVAALATALRLPAVVLTGHSMGAFVAATAAVRHPQLADRLLLVDGGVGFPRPAGVDPDELITAVIGPAMTRLSMTFPDRAAYRTFWQRHPAFADDWSDWADAYIQRDLTGTEPELRSTCRLDAVRADSIDLFDSEEVLGAVHRLPCPALLLRAERGLMDEAQGLYDPKRLEAAALDPDRLAVELVPDTNHYSILIGERGARTVADRLLAAAR